MCRQTPRSGGATPGDAPMTTAPCPPAAEGQLYYMHTPTRRRRVTRPVEFLPASEFVADEPPCRALWDMIATIFKTRGKFLAIWQCVRYVALMRHGEELVGALSVS